MRWVRVVLRWSAGAAVLLILVVGLALVLTARPVQSDLYPPRGDDPAMPILLVDHGYHVGLIVPVSRISAAAAATESPALADLAARFAGVDWLEIGWGDEAFYRFAPTLGDVRIGMALSALAGFDDGSVLHVVGFSGDPRRVFSAGDVAGLTLGERGFERLARGVAAAFALSPGAVRRCSGRASTAQACSIGRTAATVSSMTAITGSRSVSPRPACRPLRCRRRCPGA